MTLLVTGALGNVGRWVVRELGAHGHQVVALDLPRREALRGGTPVRMLFGEITDPDLVSAGLEGVDAVIHLAAIIPPRADREPDIARHVNVEGTRTLVRAMEERTRAKPGAAPRLVYASSVAVYGDRRLRPLITEEDVPSPNPEDAYGNQKLEAEEIIRASRLEWSILRLSYVVAGDALVMDPLLYEMPPETAIEPCHVADVACALRVAAETPAAVGRTFLIAGGAGWRIMYRDYLDLMFRAFGLGRNFLPADAFGKGPFHCAFMDTAVSNGLLRYQHRSFVQFIDRVRRDRRMTRLLLTAVRPVARAYLLSRSPHFRRYLALRARGEAARLHLQVRVCLGLGVPRRRAG